VKYNVFNLDIHSMPLPYGMDMLFDITLHCIAVRGSKARHNDHKVWNMSYKYRKHKKAYAWYHTPTQENPRIYSGYTQGSLKT
jgi:hypothetical protein